MLMRYILQILKFITCIFYYIFHYIFNNYIFDINEIFAHYNFRLTSCQAANGLLILPGKTDDKTEAADGDEFDALVIGELRL